MKYWAIICAAGKGTRMQTSLPKQYLTLQNQTVLDYSLNLFLQHPQIHQVVLVVNNAEEISELSRYANNKLLLALGGATRGHSVINGLLKIKSAAHADDWVLVHDAARPCLRLEDLNKLLNQLQDHPVGGLLATPVKDTLKKIKTDNKITTVERNNIWQALTPQMFRYEKLFAALQHALDNAIEITDDAQAIELMGESPAIIEGRKDNIKITYPEDLLLAETILSRVIPAKAGIQKN